MKKTLTLFLISIASMAMAQESALTPPSIIKGPWKEKMLRQRWYYPYGNATPEYLQRAADEIKNMPDEQSLSNGKVATVNAWENIGPFGIIPGSTIVYSGRVKDVEYTKQGTLRILSATGGLWQIDSLSNGTIVNQSLSDHLDCNSGGAFATDPNNSDVIFLGTGEGALSGGCGLWKTTDKGVTWTKLTLTPQPSTFYELIIINGNPLKLYAAANTGLYQSDDGGVTWTRTKQGEITDVVVNPTNPNNIVLAQWNSGIYRSIDGGLNFIKNTSAPGTNVGRTALDIALSSPNIIYSNITENTSNGTKGIYKSVDDGATWTKCVLGNDINGNPANSNFHGNQGWYDNSIGVNPTDPNIVMAGGVSIFRTTDGNIFNEVDGRHADQHAVSFAANNWCIIGNDGGVFISKNNGFSFNTINTATNNLPITQYIDCSASKASASSMLGGTQDNGTVYRSTNVPNWTTTGGDGGGVASDPFFPLNLYTAVGVYGGTHAFHRQFSANGGMSWQDNTTGIDPNGQWYPALRLDNNTGALYTNASSYLYRTFDFGVTWEKVNPNNAFTSEIYSFSIDQSGSSEPSIYTLVNSKVKVRDRNLLQWVDRTGTLPNLGFNQIQADFVLPDRVFATVTDISAAAAGNKVFRSDDIGLTWTNISGNLPNVPITDILPSPINANIYYVATTEGGFKTLDGGITWVKWANGLPKRVEMSKLDYIDSTSINGKFYVLASTYGRGLWLRDVSGDDPLSVFNQHQNYNSGVTLVQVKPNPALENSVISFHLSSSTNVNLSLYDFSGKLIKTITNREFSKGVNQQLINLQDVEAGVYTLRISTAEGQATQKIIKL
ncbi:MAG TPA: T9SS type A sorting domain-containing protein [Bacteroidia bacterium]|nr:T9SS type A sorting domain-containing protein [Bacteroidia bacterium]